ncbi:DUF427 domain-containing protein [Salinisphaera aquimarina]|uniref:DUF427 domain-containing protein n=1 Tax=Salinisphaera aquimarina TaxID=2094031 RepID=A0ABV7EJX5_9GAMM
MPAGPDDRIRLNAFHGRVRATTGEQLVADTCAAIELHETGYPVRLYLPRADIAPGTLRVSDKRTHCPFKGDATYFNLQHAATTLDDAAWSYEQPIDAMAAIAGYLSFDHPQLTLHIEEY